MKETTADAIELIILFIILVGFLTFIFYGSLKAHNDNIKNVSETPSIKLTHADMSENLIVDDSTGIVYVSYYYAGELTLAPYYSSRGLLYKYEDGELVEVPK